jgi:hypothetical protein
MERVTPHTVASLVWQLPSEMHELQADAVRRLGYQHRFFLYDEAIPDDADIVLIQGPFGSLLPFAHQLLVCDPANRPAVAYWFEESLDMQRPEWFRRALAPLFSELRRAADRVPNEAPGFLERQLAQYVRSRGHRYRYLGDILWLCSRGLIDVLALSSSVYSDYLMEYGISSVVVPRGYHPDYGELRNLQRDIAVLWMGQTRTKRRRDAVYWLRKELAQRGQLMHIHDGETSGFIFGEERTRLLNRTCFVLNVFTQPADELSIRYYVAAANGAVILTEPGANRYPFVAGEHLVECPIDAMPDKVMYYLEHLAEWNRLSSNMLALMQNHLTLEDSLAAILTEAEETAFRRYPCRR